MATNQRDLTDSGGVPPALPQMSATLSRASRRAGVLLICYFVAVAAWWLANLAFVASRGEASGNYIMPSPLATVDALWAIVSSWDNASHIGITFLRTLVGVVLSGLLGLTIVLLARYVRVVREFFLSVFYPGLRALPTLSIALLAVVWFGLGTPGVVFVIVVTVLPIYLIDLWEGLKVLDGSLVQMAQAISTNTRRIFAKLILPMLIPRVFASSKLGFSVAFKLALVGEVFAATEGIGYELYRNLQEARSDFVYAWTLVVVIVVILFDYYVFDVIDQKYLYRWKSLKP